MKYRDFVIICLFYVLQYDTVFIYLHFNGLYSNDILKILLPSNIILLNYTLFSILFKEKFNSNRLIKYLVSTFFIILFTCCSILSGFIWFVLAR